MQRAELEASVKVGRKPLVVEPGGFQFVKMLARGSGGCLLTMVCSINDQRGRPGHTLFLFLLDSLAEAST